MDIGKSEMWHTGTYTVRQYPFKNLNVSGTYKHNLVINEASGKFHTLSAIRNIKAIVFEESLFILLE